MKRIILATIIVLAIFAFATLPANAVTWHTNRDDITIPSGNADISHTEHHNGTVADTDNSVNLTLPCNIANLSGASSYFKIKNEVATNISFNLTVNGVAVNESSTVNWTMGNWSNVTMTQIRNKGTDNTSEYLNFTWNVNHSSHDVHLVLVGTDVNFSSSWRASVLTIKEKDVTTPTVAASSTTSYFVVNNSMNITSDLWFSLSNVELNVTFPSHKVTASVTNFTITTLANNGTDEQYTQYQKRGPYIYTVAEDVTGRTHEVSIALKGREALRVVDWTLIPSASVYEGFFDTLDYTTLEATLNGVSKSWTEGSIVMEDITVQVAQSNNRWVFTWTVPAAVTVDARIPVISDIVDILSDITHGLPNLLWLLGAVATIVVVSVVIYTKYPTKKKTK